MTSLDFQGSPGTSYDQDFLGFDLDFFMKSRLPMSSSDFLCSPGTSYGQDFLGFD